MKKIFALLLSVAMLSSCGTNDSNSSASKKIVSIVGSTTVQPVAQEVADGFKVLNPDILVEIQGVGSSAGIKAVIDGTADIGASSRELTQEEKSNDIDEIIFAKDGIAIIVNKENNIEDISMEEIKKIFEGEIISWKELGGPDERITVISREDGSGTRDAFNEIVSIDDYIESALVCDSNGSIKSSVASKPHAIGYVSIGIVDDAVNALKVDGIEPTANNVKNGEYKVQRNLLLLTKGEVSPESQEYLNYLMSDEGQNIVAEQYVPVN